MATFSFSFHLSRSRFILMGYYSNGIILKEGGETVEIELKEMLGLILDKLDGLESGMDKLVSRMDRLESRMDRLESRMDRLESRMDGLESRMDRLESRMDGLESRMDGLESRMDGSKSRQDEIYLVVKAIEHNNQVHGAEIDNLKFKASHMEGTINAVGDVIATRKAI